ncbi:hypothetical protein AVEN_258302-1 [Araneus ventricosus]|uniref:Uncharacterized protein n=1 Tax=Araneus ventricosus TaxID=182803 RepID=A0A4Y2U624_ARAVE|nr:hypothetical protein AVEN_258302-1 [Araneus ventricosus]
MHILQEELESDADTHKTMLHDRQLLDSIRDSHADNGQNRWNATERTWDKYPSEFDILDCFVKGTMDIKLYIRDSIEFIFPENKLVAECG